MALHLEGAVHLADLRRPLDDRVEIRHLDLAVGPQAEVVRELTNVLTVFPGVDSVLEDAVAEVANLVEVLRIALPDVLAVVVVDSGAGWQRIADAFASTARSGKIAAALEAAIRDLGAVLAKHFPAQAGQTSRVPDRLIEL